MISVSEARKIIHNNVMELEPVKVPIEGAFSRILAKDIISAIDYPSFEQSGMDGYAFNAHDIESFPWLKIIGEIKAGDHTSFKVQKGQAFRIFTGARLPQGADTVLMQENAEVKGDQLFFKESPIPGMNVRSKGSQTSAGDLVLKKGKRLTPAAIGFLAGLGEKEITVNALPDVSIVITGNELITSGENRGPASVFESNSIALKAAFSELGIFNLKTIYCKDDPGEIVRSIEWSISHSNLLIITGGISVGDYDFVKAALNQYGVETLFYGVNQKPGKPLFFGRYKTIPVFAVPGNPASALTCFYEYIRPAVLKMSGNQALIIKGTKKRLSASFHKKSGLTYFIKGLIKGREVIPLHSQESFQMNSFAIADCLIELNENKTGYNPGDLVDVHLLYPKKKRNQYSGDHEFILH